MSTVGKEMAFRSAVNTLNSMTRPPDSELENAVVIVDNQGLEDPVYMVRDKTIHPTMESFIDGLRLLYDHHWIFNVKKDILTHWKDSDATEIAPGILTGNSIASLIQLMKSRAAEVLESQKCNCLICACKQKGEPVPASYKKQYILYNAVSLRNSYPTLSYGAFIEFLTAEINKGHDCFTLDEVKIIMQSTVNSVLEFN